MKLCVQWPRLGPYHLARLEGAFKYLGPLGIEVVAFETATQDDTYAWRVEARDTAFKRKTVFPGATYEDIGSSQMRKGIGEALSNLLPNAVAICGYSGEDAWATLLWCKRRGVPTILMMDTREEDALRQWPKEWYKSQIVKQFDAALCSGTESKRYLEKLGMPTRSIFLGYDCVDNSYFGRKAAQIRAGEIAVPPLPGLDDFSPFFLASCRFIPRKNLEGLMLAYAYYSRRSKTDGSTPWRLVILGDGEDRPKLEALKRTCALDDVVLAGFRQIDELPFYYARASAFIHPALHEQWGLVVNEAMASALPVLVSRTTGCALDLVIEGRTGLSFDASKSGEIADRMWTIASDPALTKRMGEEAQKHISRWSPAKMAGSLKEIVSIICDPNRNERSGNAFVLAGLDFARNVARRMRPNAFLSGS